MCQRMMWAGVIMGYPAGHPMHFRGGKRFLL
jgi:hypothetical protein